MSKACKELLIWLLTLLSCSSKDGTWKREYLFRRCSKKGTLVHVRLDCDHHRLWFAAEGVDFPTEPAFSNLPALPLYPSFDLDNKGSCFTVEQRKFTPTMPKKQ